MAKTRNEMLLYRLIQEACIYAKPTQNSHVRRYIDGSMYDATDEHHFYIVNCDDLVDELMEPGPVIEEAKNRLERIPHYCRIKDMITIQTVQSSEEPIPSVKFKLRE